MMFADMGARVIRIDRPAKPAKPDPGMAALSANNVDVLARNRESVPLDLKQPGSVDTALQLIAQADVLIDGERIEWLQAAFDAG